MKTVKHCFSLTWTDPDGVPQAAAGHYDKNAATKRRRALKAFGCTHVEVVVVKAGELPEPVL
ncbi:hypothetical protein ABZT23_20130 [Streptomyces sp. NPDC005386]|uniref:hypothetical protein n=1 Tax=Streptomyces sp. NPDC005386 TaxID=3154562 RepID=UPI0033AB8F00